MSLYNTCTSSTGFLLLEFFSTGVLLLIYVSNVLFWNLDPKKLNTRGQTNQYCNQSLTKIVTIPLQLSIFPYQHYSTPYPKFGYQSYSYRKYRRRKNDIFLQTFQTRYNAHSRSTPFDWCILLPIAKIAQIRQQSQCVIFQELRRIKLRSRKLIRDIFTIGNIDHI